MEIKIDSCKHCGKGFTFDSESVPRYRVDAAPLRPGVCHAEVVAHDRRPQTSGGPEFGDLFKEVVVDVEEERKTRGELGYVHPPLHGFPDVPGAVGQRIG